MVLHRTAHCSILDNLLLKNLQLCINFLLILSNFGTNITEYLALKLIFFGLCLHNFTLSRQELKCNLVLKAENFKIQK